MRSAAAAAAAGALALAVLLAPAHAGTLTPSEIEAKLRGIPMFVLTDAEGAPLVAQGSFGVFTDKGEAEAFRRVLKAQKPEIGDKVLVTAIPLSEIVRLTGPGSSLRPEFVGPQSERDAAAALRGKDAEPMGDAPLFVVRAGEAYLTMTKDDRSLIPIFFSKKQADDVVARYVKGPDDAPARVDVTSLETILNSLIGGDDPDLARILLVPSEAMMAAIPHDDAPPSPKPGSSAPAAPVTPKPR